MGIGLNMFNGFLPLGGGSGWTPMSPTQPLLWLKADAGVSLSTNEVTSWADQSGHGWSFAPRNSSIRPTYSATGWNSSKPAIQFGSSYKELINQSTGLADLGTSFKTRIYMTLDVSVGSGVQKILSWIRLSGSNGVYEVNSDNNIDEIAYSSGGTLLTGNALSGKNNVSYLINRPTDGYTRSWINGVSSIVNNNAAPTSITDTVAFGGNAISGISIFTGSIAEVVVYDITSGDIDVMNKYNEYAKNKWGGLP